MTVFNLGSINADHFYRVPRIPAPGETIAATAVARGLGGKGANQSIAAAKAGARVVHIGSVGQDGDWLIDVLGGAGVETGHITKIDQPTGHAVINVAEDGENAIVILSAANVSQESGRILAALEHAKRNDFMLLQNETNLVPETAALARQKGLGTVYSAAPFDAAAARAVLPHVDLLVLNEVEAGQLAAVLGCAPGDLPVPEVLITRGARGATHMRDGKLTEMPAFAVRPVDTTGAGDTYLGAFVAARDQGMDVASAMRLAAAFAAIQVTRPGTADAIPGREEVEAFLAARS